MQSLFNSHGFNDKYYYGGVLGANCSDQGTVFRVWAPLANAVYISLYKKSFGRTDEDIIRRPMNQAGNGVYTVSFSGNLHGWYYTYSVRNNGGTEIETIDPYARSSGINGKRGMVVDASSPLVTPEGWLDDKPVKLQSYTDAVIYETHVRDFSVNLGTEYSGKFLSFTVDGLKTAAGSSKGLAHLKELGITHVHLLPVAETASVDQFSLREDDYNSYNWGYDPYNYNVPSGVYTTDPYDGNLKILELRKLVMALHSAGIGVVFDVVYNHTYSLDCPLAATVPGYFHRLDSTGRPTNGSGCGNEIASERPMCRKFILDSIEWWLNGFHADGFRFDLMGLTDIDTMTEVEKRVHALRPDAILYGEGWVGGPSSLTPRMQSSKWNACRIAASNGAAGGVAVFSDIARDGIKGPVFSYKEGGYVNGRAYENMLKVKFASMGGVSPNFATDWVAPSASHSITYVSAHDNLALYDKLGLTCKDEKEKLKKNVLAAAIVLTSRGVPFFQAGEEMLRSKKKKDGTPDDNSYRSPDEVNGINWNLKDGKNGKTAFNEYKKLIALRKRHPVMRLSNAGEIEKATNFIIVRYDVVAYTLEGRGEKLLVIYNPLNELDFTLPPGEWVREYGPNEGETASGEIKVPEISCLVFSLKQ